jgi:hypothetical protein
MKSPVARAGVALLVALLGCQVEAKEDAGKPAAKPAPAEHPCAADALEHAKKLLSLHADGEQGDIGKNVSVLPPIQNPSNKAQKFDVLGVTGFVYKAEYRMRFLYAQIPDQCVLVGQEILELTSL